MKYVYCAGVLALSSVQVLHVEYNYNCKSDEFNLRFDFLNSEDKGSLFSYVIFLNYKRFVKALVEC